jgi:hypothetical protein
MAFTEDLSLFFDTTDGFAVDARITDGGSFDRSLAVLFNDPTSEISVYDASIEELQANFLTPAATMDGVERDFRVVITGDARTFYVDRLHPDGNGMMFVFLRNG